MPHISFRTAGESHGPALVALIEGVPAGLPLLAADVDEQLRRRQQGYGRGRRMVIETDRVEFLAGVRAGETFGAPVALLVRNRDWAKLQIHGAVRHGNAAVPDDHHGRRERYVLGQCE